MLARRLRYVNRPLASGRLGVKIHPIPGQLEARPGLLGMAQTPCGDRVLALIATCAAIEILAWLDHFAEVADLAEALIDSDDPLLGALLNAEVRTGIPARPRIAALAQRVPEGRPLKRQLGLAR